MIRTFYSLWKRKDNNDEETIFLEEESIFRTRLMAFRRARQLTKELIDGWGFDILVRKITIGSNVCKEWEFKPDRRQ